MTHFAFRHEFRAPGVEVFWRCYFDPEHNAELDRRTGIARRHVLSRDDDGHVLRRSIQLTPRRRLPAFVRKLAGRDLSYVEHSVFYRARDRIEYDIVPSMLSGRISLTAVYRIEPGAPGRIVRHYDGDVTVAVPGLGRRIEQRIVAEMASSFEVAAQVSQEFLDRVASSG